MLLVTRLECAVVFRTRLRFGVCSWWRSACRSWLHDVYQFALHIPWPPFPCRESSSSVTVAAEVVPASYDPYVLFGVCVCCVRRRLEVPFEAGMSGSGLHEMLGGARDAGLDVLTPTSQPVGLAHTDGARGAGLDVLTPTPVSAWHTLTVSPPPSPPPPPLSLVTPSVG